MKQTFLLFLLISSTCSIFAQKYMTGTIRSLDHQKPLADVEVFNELTKKLEVSDRNGNFKVWIDAGYNTLIFFSENHQTLNLTVSENDPDTLNIELAPLNNELNAVTILARREELFALRQYQKVNGTTIYSGKKNDIVVMDKIVGNLASNTARQIYSRVSGLNIYDNGDAGLQLNIGGRGLDPNRSSNFNTRQNGYDISADVLGYPESYYTPTAYAISEIQIIRGAASLQYGSQFGGLVNFVLKKAPSQKPFSIDTKQTIGSYGLFNSYNKIAGTVGKLDYSVFHNYKKSSGYRENSDFTSNNTYLDVGYELNSKTKLRAQYTYLHYLAHQSGGLTDKLFERDPQFSNRTRNWFEVDWNLYSFAIDHEFNEENKLHINAFGLNASRKAIGFRGNPLLLNSNPITTIDEQDSDGNFIYARDNIQGNFKNWGIETRYLNESKLFSKQAISLLGLKYYQANNTSEQGAASTGIGPEFEFENTLFPDYPNQSSFTFPNRNIAAFTEVAVDLNQQITISPGARYEWIKTESLGQYSSIIFDNAGNPLSNQTIEDNRILERSFFLAGIGISYIPNDFLEVYGNISQNYRSVTFSDIRVVNPTFKIDPDLVDETGFSTDLGLRGRIQRKLAYDLNVYSLNYNNRIGIVLDEKANRVRTNIGKALIFGLESNVSFNFLEIAQLSTENFLVEGFTNFAWTHSNYNTPNEGSIDGNQVEFVPQTNLKTGVELGYKNFRVSGQFSYISQQFTDAENSLTPPSGDRSSGIIGTVPSYSIIDISGKYNIKNFTIESGINNLSNTSYFTRRALGYPGPGILPADGRSFYLTLGFKL